MYLNALKKAELKDHTITLDRTGKPPLRFTGKLVTEASGEGIHAPKDKPNPDFYVINIYQTPNAGYVVQVIYTKELRGETTRHYFAVATDDPAATLGEYDPLAVLVGFPPGEQFTERQRALETKAKRQYDTLVTAVLKTFPDDLGDIDDGYHRGTLVARYNQLMDIGRQELDFTQQEAMLLCDALNGTLLIDDTWRHIPAEIEDACRLDLLDAKWSVDGIELLDKLNRVSPLGLCAVANGVETFWRNPGQDTLTALRNAGLVHKRNLEGAVR